MANSTMETTFQNLIKVIKEKTAPKSHTHGKADITDFPSSMPASDVYTWAKEPNKPSYTASEVDAFSATDGANLTNTVGNIQLDITQLGISKIGISKIGIAGGVASLDSNGHVPSSQIPEEVEDLTVTGDLSIKKWDNIWNSPELFSIGDSPNNDIRMYGFYKDTSDPSSIFIKAYIASYDMDFGYQYTMYSFYGPGAANPGRYIKLKFTNASTNEEVYSLLLDSEDLPTNTQSDPMIIEITDAASVNLMPLNIKETVLNDCIPDSANSSNKFATMNDIDTAITQVLAASY